jgi:hypothetical protein
MFCNMGRQGWGSVPKAQLARHLRASMKTMHGRAFVFINYEQAARFGHVGWGFSIDEQSDLFYFGSTDHLWRHPWWDLAAWMRYAHVLPADNNDWWSTTGSYAEMVGTMHAGHHIRYHSLKELTVPDANPQRAVSAAEALAKGGWSVLVNNCVHQTYTVLTEYGAQIPAPAEPVTNLIPKVWFQQLAGQRLDLG